jgi:signal transduction histidine kinase
MDRGGENRIPEQFFRELQVQFLVHELKDPIAIIEAGVRSLLEKRGKSGPLSPRQEKTLKRVLRGALKGRSMLNNLLEIGRSEAGQIIGGSFCPAKIIYADLLASIETMEGELFEQISELMSEDAVLNFLKQAGISYDVASGMDDIKIIQDEAKFSQIVGNLIKNALRFRKERLEIRLLREKEMIVVEIGDDGPGIKQKDHGRIFQPYVQAEAKSTLTSKGHGLGLAGALILAKGLGGDVSVQSEVGKGATFRFTLPLRIGVEQ